ncbi:MAG: tetratricopeptide repeat protein, partial [Myxococcaceae bacterium]|nr:tetratricopeptide repeat protein [Myxococcaceae bacterium]
VEAGVAAAERARAQLHLEPGAVAAVHVATVQVRTFASSMRVTGAEVSAPSWLGLESVAAAAAAAQAQAAPARVALIGRAAELAAIDAALASAPVVVLIGPAGVGKTRLLEAAVERHPGLEALDDTAHFVAAGRRLLACRETHDPRLQERPGEVVHVRVEPLAPRDAVALLRELIRPVEFVADVLLERLAAPAHGVPGLLYELARAIAVSGDLKPDPQTGEWRLAPDAALLKSSTPLFEQLAASALGTVPRDHHDVARLCAVLGELPLEQALEAAKHLPRDRGASSLDVRRALARLERAGLLALDGGRVRFVRRAVAESIERSLSPALRRALHDAAWRAFERDPEPSAARARHAAAGGRFEAAQADASVLAERAADVCRDIDAETHLSAALALPSGSATERAGWLWRRARARRRNQRFGEARADLSLALTLVTSGPLAGEVWLERATVADWSEDFAGSQAALDEAEKHGVAGEAGRLRLELARGRSSLRKGEWVRACERLARVAAEARGVEPEVEVVARLLDGASAAVLGRLDDAETQLGTALERARARGDHVHAGVALSNRVLLWLGRDQVDDAIADLRESVRLASEWGHPQNERWNSHNLAQFLLWLGRAQEALPLAERAHSLGRRFFGEALPPTSSLLLARVRLELGDLEGARALVAKRPGAASAADVTQAALLELKLAAEPERGPWLALQPDVAAPVDDQIDLLLESARGLERAGHTAEAEQRREQARALLPSGTAALWRRVLQRP